VFLIVADFASESEKPVFICTDYQILHFSEYDKYNGFFVYRLIEYRLLVYG